MDDEGVRDPQIRERRGHEIDHLRGKDPEHLRVRSRGVGQRPQQIKNCP